MTLILSYSGGKKSLITLPESGGSGGGILTASASNLIWCIAGGSYLTGQGAVNAAVDGQTVLFGPKPGGWGDIVLPAGKRINLVGLQADRGLIAEIKSLTFSPSTELNINQNECAVSNLFINQTANLPALIFSGSAPARIRNYGTYIYSSTGTADLVQVNNSGAGSSLYLECCNIQTSAARTALSVNSYCRIRRSDITSGGKSLSVTGGQLDGQETLFQSDTNSEVINLSGGRTYLGMCSILNAGPTGNGSGNGSGIAMSLSGLNMLSLSLCGFGICFGSGYCIKGTGPVLYDRWFFSDSAALSQNKKIQNTLTLIPYASSPTLSA